jgi:uncharacterized damage-inducible protein DinB
MNAVSVLRQSADFSFTELVEAIAGVDEAKSWAVVMPIEGEYLNTAGSIIAVVQHIAACKLLYASSAFTNQVPRGREVFERTKQIGTNWALSKQFLDESQAYWMESWSSLTDDQLENRYGNIWGTTSPAWKIISRVIHHDQYHAGQINMIRSIAQSSTSPPDMRFDEEEKYARESPTW